MNHLKWNKCVVYMLVQLYLIFTPKMMNWLGQNILGGPHKTQGSFLDHRNWKIVGKATKIKKKELAQIALIVYFMYVFAWFFLFVCLYPIKISLKYVSIKQAMACFKFQEREDFF